MKSVYPFYSAYLTDKLIKMEMDMIGGWYKPQFYWIKFLYDAHRGGY